VEALEEALIVLLDDAHANTLRLQYTNPTKSRNRKFRVGITDQYY
jgi:hypothetical protein